jgi:hypothetical protein
MIALFINQHSDAEVENSIECAQAVVGERRNDSIDHDQTHVLNVYVDRIQIQELLQGMRQPVHRVEYG